MHLKPIPYIANAKRLSERQIEWLVAEPFDHEEEDPEPELLRYAQAQIRNHAAEA